jgi:signal transduction histidine kinase
LLLKKRNFNCRYTAFINKTLKRNYHTGKYTGLAIGISEEDLGKLFQPFAQLDSSLTRHYEGTGLGLAMVKLLVELHDGQVFVTSSLNKGSCFSFWLPMTGNDS